MRREKTSPAARRRARFDLVLALSRYLSWSRTEVLGLGLSEARHYVDSLNKAARA